jgi:sugar lactone lactonase YvrE
MKRAWLVSLAALGGCFQATPPDGALACGNSPHECPPGYFCSVVGTCWADGHTPALQLTQLSGKLGGAGQADGVGQQARFNTPLALVRDGDGSLYVSDSGNHTIRKITPDGTVTTVAGTAVSKPNGEVLDGNTLYVRDANGVRVVDLAAGTARTISLSFDAAGIAFYSGALWLTDPKGRIVEIDAASGFMRQYMTGGFIIEPRGIVSDGTGNLFVGDKGSNMVYRVRANLAFDLYGNGESGSTDGPPWEARFSGPQGVALDGKGSLFVSDTFNCTIRKIDLASGTVSTVAATRGSCGAKDGPPNVGQLNWPMGLVHDGNDTLFIAEFLNHTVRKLSVSTGELTSFVGLAPTPGGNDGPLRDARFNAPARIAADERGNLFVADSDNATIRQVNLVEGRVSTLAGSRLDHKEADGIAEARFDAPRALIYDGAGHLYVGDGRGRAIRKVVIETGEVTTIAGSGAFGRVDGIGKAAEFAEPTALALDGAGHLFVADALGPTIRQIDLATGEVTTPYGEPDKFATLDGNGGAAHFTSPAGLAYWEGALFVSDRNDHVIRRVDLERGYVSHFAGILKTAGSQDGVGVATFNRPADLVVDGRGHLFVADNGSFAIRRIQISRDRADEVTTLAGTPARAIVEPGVLPASLNDGLGLALLPTGGLAVSVLAENSLLLLR